MTQSTSYSNIYYTYYYIEVYCNESHDTIRGEIKMNKLKMISATALSAAVMAIMASPVGAQSVDITNDQNCSNTGAYGQVTCTIENEVEQKSKVVYKDTCTEYTTRKDGTKVCVHPVENTALDTQTMVVAISTMLSGAAGVVIKIKNHA